MRRLWADFNSRTPDGFLTVLQEGERDLAECAVDLGIKDGDKVVLYQDDGDFEIVGTVEYRYHEALGCAAWLARPDPG